MIELRNLHKHFGTKEVLGGINLRIQQGETVALIGPSGSGKTTLLRCINFLEYASDGHLKIDDLEVSLKKPSRRNILGIQRKTAMVFQQYNLFRNMNILHNVSLGLRVARKQTRAEAERAASAALTKVGLGDRLDSYPLELSGGQQQRVGIARAIALNPRIILFDEPTSALDPELVGEVLAVIKELAQQGQTMLIVSHEMNFVRKIANRVVFLDGGLLVEEGTAEEIFLRPKKERTIQFLKTVTDDWYFKI